MTSRYTDTEAIHAARKITLAGTAVQDSDFNSMAQVSGEWGFGIGTSGRVSLMALLATAAGSLSRNYSLLSQVGVSEPEPEWTPESLPGLVAWWDASDDDSITDDANGVSEWAGKVDGQSPSTLIQTVDARKPNVQAAAHNSLQAIRFIRANSERLQGYAAPFTGRPFSMFVIGASTNLTDWQYLLQVANSGGVAYESLSFPGSQPGDPAAVDFDSGSSFFRVHLSDGGYTSGQAHLVGVIERTVTNRDLVFDLETKLNTASWPQDLVYNRVLVGAWNPNTPGSHLNGDVCEIIMCNTPIGATALSSLRAYAQTKWGTPSS